MSDNSQYIVFHNLREAGKGDEYGEVVQVKPAATPFKHKNACGIIAEMSFDDIRSAGSNFAQRFKEASAKMN